MDVKYVLDAPGQSIDRNPLDSVNDYVKKAFPSAVLEEHFGHRVTYKIPSSDITSLAKSFSSLEQGIYIFTSVRVRQRIYCNGRQVVDIYYSSFRMNNYVLYWILTGKEKIGIVEYSFSQSTLEQVS